MAYITNDSHKHDDAKTYLPGTTLLLVSVALFAVVLLGIFVMDRNFIFPHRALLGSQHSVSEFKIPEAMRRDF